MNDKFFIVVIVPLIEKEFDLYIPITKKVGTIKNLIIQLVAEQSDQVLLDSFKSLYDKNSGERIEEEEYVKESKIKNGSKLILY